MLANTFGEIDVKPPLVTFRTLQQSNRIELIVEAGDNVDAFGRESCRVGLRRALRCAGTGQRYIGSVVGR